MQWRVNLRPVLRSLFTLAAVASFIAAIGVLYGWRQSYTRHPPCITRMQVSEAKKLRVIDTVNLVRGAFLWGRNVEDHYSPVGRYVTPGRYPRGDAVVWYHFAPDASIGPEELRLFGFYVVSQPDQDWLSAPSRPLSSSDDHSAVVFPLYVPLVIFLILPLAWARSAWRRRHDRGRGFPMDVNQTARPVNQPTLGDPPPATARV
jgi:hypothetical protein